ncbi:MAG TPA: hypothetical protein VEV81_13745, partial [Pyrinomonadaceae bacterium]|nr:hypothetical protein [Pyrinomonadaceae bacterium]
MADENRQPDAPQGNDAEGAPETGGASAPPRTDDKSPSPGSVIANAGTLPQPENKGASPESQAALTGKAPSGSSTSGTTVPASTTDPAKPAAPAGDATAPARQPPGGASPDVGDPTKSPSQSDLEKAAKIAEAKARAAAAKQAAGDKPAPAQPAAGTGAPKAPVKKKDEGPKPVDAANHPLVKRLREALDGAVM